MCLLVVVSRLDPGAPLVVGANRDERLDRPAAAMTVLRPAGPRILGGRDEEAGGTWLAVNEHGVVAGLTNRPSPEGRDPAKRSRGELPVALARHRDASSAVEEFVAKFRPWRYNPAWLLVGDRTSLYALDMTGTVEDRPLVEALPPGVHILENNALHAPSLKADHVRALLGDGRALGGEVLVDRLRSVLGDHSIPVPAATASPRTPDEDDTGDESENLGPRPIETLAACVHTDTYGTRSSTLLRVPAPSNGHPRVLVADGHPCTSTYLDMTDLFQT